MKITTFKKLLIVALSIGLFLTIAVGLILYDRVYGLPGLDRIVPKSLFSQSQILEQKVIREESIVIDIAERVSPSVVTVSVETPRRRVLQYNPFGGGFEQRLEGGTPQDIGTGFVISKDGLIATNKHVVDAESAKYKVITKDGKEYEVTKITRDPANDLAILKIDATNLTPLELGSSDNLKAGQFVIAIGTALGEFRHTVTTGVISGLGRGITAGDPLQGFVERLDDVIQTDAAINPGNSGGPLLNSAGQVIGVNVAVAQGAQNIGFAIPVNVLKKGLQEFNASGSFASKPFLGVQYQMIGKQSAVLNNVPQGAYVVEVVEGSPAEKSGIQVDDIIIEIDGERVSDTEDGLASIISKKKSGSTVSIKIWRNSEEKTLQVTLTPQE